MLIGAGAEEVFREIGGAILLCGGQLELGDRTLEYEFSLKTKHTIWGFCLPNLLGAAFLRFARSGGRGAVAAPGIAATVRGATDGIIPSAAVVSKISQP